MIYFGSGAEFSRPHWTPQMTEEVFEEHVPLDQYGYSKYLMNKHASLSENIYNLRVFGLFGKYDDWRYRFIPNACCKAALGLPIRMRHNAIFDYLYIDDLVAIVDWVINNNPKHKDYNICSGEAVSYQSLAGIILEASGKKLDIIVENESDAYEYSGNNSRIIAETGITLTEICCSVRELYEWYSENSSIIDKELFVY
jgi:UDP-glucose 4-epimerase